MAPGGINIEAGNYTYPGLYLVDGTLEVEVQPAGISHHRVGGAVLAEFRFAFRAVHVENQDAGECTGDYAYALDATFLKGDTQTYASDTSAV